jgi:squalene-hopene/tetraprenyl-beta-curcumene cyclase
MDTATFPTMSRRSAASPEVGISSDRAAARRLDSAIEQAQNALLLRQAPEGYWCGELQGDSILESEYLLLMWIIGEEANPDLPKIANYLRDLQNPDGGWSLYPGGPPDVSGTVKAYFALKLMGDDPHAAHMEAARAVCLRLGGAAAVNSFSKFYLAALDQVSYDQCPSIPPEIVFLPKWAYFNLYHVSAWTRTMILPLSLVVTHRPVRPLPTGMDIGELFLPGTRGGTLADAARLPPRSWKDVFLLFDRALKRYDSSPVEPIRERARERAKEWILARMDGSAGLGAIFPPMVYMLIVMRLVWKWPTDHPRVEKAHRELRDFFIREGETIRLQPCLSPVWDTGIAMHALAEAGIRTESDAASAATAWLLSKECTRASDWRMNCDGAETGGWFFEFENPHYPDVDDTAMVTMSLLRLGGPLGRDACRRGVAWLLAMQNDDGGWAAFDRTRDRPILERIPFADHNAMQDPSCPDITGRVLECLGHAGFSTADPAVRRAIAFIESRQEPEGCWFGRWGVNYIYGTWQVLAGLAAVKDNMQRPGVRRATAWLRSVQKPDGSWGESCATYEDPSLKGTGESTASQTAWGVMGMLAACGPSDPSVGRGVEWLIERQDSAGEWDEPHFTGTGFPRVFYLRYHLYRLYFPLMALGRVRRLAGD